MHINKEKSLADAAFYKAVKEIESNKVFCINLFEFTEKYLIVVKHNRKN